MAFNMSSMRNALDLLTDLESQKWFHGFLQESEAEKLLRKNGDFLVSESSDTNKCSLFLYWDGPLRFDFKKYAEGWAIDRFRNFLTIPYAVESLMVTGLTLAERRIAYLENPVLRKTWQLRNDDVMYESEPIAEGNFGEVYKGKYRGFDVAVKKVRNQGSDEQIKSLLQEGMILIGYSHPHIVRFIGIAAEKSPILIVMEYMSEGSLSDYLRRNEDMIDKKQLTEMALQAAKGMEYLEENGCIHRDLAARNCLVDEHMTVKIADFGLSRMKEVYHMVDRKNKEVPIVAAPESLIEGIYSSKSDVWSFGILMWEIFTKCSNNPYHGFPDAVRAITDGRIMQEPKGTPVGCYSLMKKCWNFKPKDRCTFSEIKKQLEGIYISM